MAPKLKLIYFDAAGRGEPIRLILKHGGIPFEDYRLPRDDWSKTKPTMPWGQLPVLEVDGQLIGQSQAISRYVAKLAKLNGKDDFEDLKIDEVVDTLGDIFKKMIDLRFEQNEDKKKTLLQTLLNETLPFYLKRLDERVKQNNGFLAIPKFTWADIMFITFYEGSYNLFKKDVFVDYPNLIQLKKDILNIPSIKDHIQTRPANKFPPGNIYDLKNDL